MMPETRRQGASGRPLGQNDYPMTGWPASCSVTRRPTPPRVPGAGRRPPPAGRSRPASVDDRGGVILLHRSRTPKDALFQAEFAALARRRTLLHLQVGPRRYPGSWLPDLAQARGLSDDEVLRQFVPDVVRRDARTPAAPCLGRRAAGSSTVPATAAASTRRGPSSAVRLREPSTNSRSWSRTAPPTCSREEFQISFGDHPRAHRDDVGVHGPGTSRARCIA